MTEQPKPEDVLAQASAAIDAHFAQKMRLEDGGPEIEGLEHMKQSGVIVDYKLDIEKKQLSIVVKPYVEHIEVEIGFVHEQS